MQTSAQMRQMIGQWEGCRLESYRDAVGVPTVGFGHTGSDVFMGQKITQAEADHLLSQDLKKFEEHVERLCPECSQQEFDALVSFAYNLGQGALAGSTLRKHHNAGNQAAAAGEFGKWNHAGGRVLAGLTRRRAGEAAVYARGDYGGGALT